MVEERYASFLPILDRLPFLLCISIFHPIPYIHVLGNIMGRQTSNYDELESSFFFYIVTKFTLLRLRLKQITMESQDTEDLNTSRSDYSDQPDQANTWPRRSRIHPHT